MRWALWFPQIIDLREFLCWSTEEKPDGIQRTHQVKDMLWAFRSSQLKFEGRALEMRALHREFQRQRMGSPWEFGWVLISTCTWGCSLKLGKEPPEKIKGNIVQCSHRVKDSDHFHQPDWKTWRFTGHWVETTEESCFNRGDNKP